MCFPGALLDHFESDQPTRTEGFLVVWSGDHEAAPTSQLAEDSAVCAVLYCESLVAVERARALGQFNERRHAQLGRGSQVHHARWC